MTEADISAGPSSRDTIIDRYSGLARTALAGDTITDCDPAAFADGGFGAAAYPTNADVPEAALRASLGCGNPLAVADSTPARPSWTLVRAAGSTSCSPPAGSARAAWPTAWMPARTCSPSPAPTQPRPASPTPASCTATSRTSRCPTGTWTWSSPTASSACPPTSHASWPRPSGSCGPAGAWASATSPPTTAPTPASSPRTSTGWLRRHAHPAAIPGPAAGRRVHRHHHRQHARGWSGPALGDHPCGRASRPAELTNPNQQSAAPRLVLHRAATACLREPCLRFGPEVMQGGARRPAAQTATRVSHSRGIIGLSATTIWCHQGRHGRCQLGESPTAADLRTCTSMVLRG